MSTAVDIPAAGATAPAAAPAPAPAGGLSVAPAPQAQPQALAVPDKFKLPDGSVNTAALLKSYSELEAAQSGKTPKPAESPDPNAQTANGPVDFAKLQQEFESSGKLSDASYKALESKGIPKDMVDAYIAAQQTAATSARSAEDAAIIASVGGEQTFKSLQTWAASALTPQQLAAYNAQVEQGGEAAKIAVTWLQSQYTSKFGTGAPSLLEGGQISSTPTFRSKQEMVSAMRDPRYDRDPAYRAEVAAKLRGMEW